MNVSDPNRAIYCDSNCGPVFGGSIVKEGEKWIRGDIRLANIKWIIFHFWAMLINIFHTCLDQEKLFFFLAGTHKFQIEEIKIYQRLK